MSVALGDAVPTTPEPATACLRWGRFLAAGGRLLAGPALSRGCLTESRREPASWFVAPAFVQVRRLVVLFLVTLVLVALLLLNDPGFPVKILALRTWPSNELGLPLSSLALLPLVYLLTVMGIPHGQERWKQKILEGLRIDLVHAHRFRVAVYTERPPSLLEAAVPPEIGLASLAAGGVAFLGTRGTRLVLPRERIASATTVRLHLLWPPRTALRVALGDGSCAHLALLDRATERENAAEAGEWAERLSPDQARPA